MRGILLSLSQAILPVLLLLHCCHSLVNPVAADGGGCRGEDGRLVDWFVVYKRPVGKSYVYRSSSTTGESWILSSQTIDAPSSLPGQTLQPLYDVPGKEGRLELMYNDELPNGTTSEAHAHAKGVVVFEGGAAAGLGFWMLHSVPHFPPAPSDAAGGSGYSFPITGLIYGQTILCVSLPTQQADLIGEQLRFYHPFVYHWRSGGEELAKTVPHLSSAASGDHVTTPPWSQAVQFISLAGISFTSFAKAKQFGLDLYGDWMTGSLGTPLYVETWTNGQGRPLPSYCANGTYTVENILQVRLNGLSPFSSHKDHSKWAIASRTEASVVCVGDINRMDSQRHRGGGSICFRNMGLWKSFYQSVSQLEACPIRPRKMRRARKGSAASNTPQHSAVAAAVDDAASSTI